MLLLESGNGLFSERLLIMLFEFVSYIVIVVNFLVREIYFLMKAVACKHGNENAGIDVDSRALSF